MYFLLILAFFLHSCALSSRFSSAPRVPPNPSQLKKAQVTTTVQAPSQRPVQELSRKENLSPPESSSGQSFTAPPKEVPPPQVLKSWSGASSSFSSTKEKKLQISLDFEGADLLDFLELVLGETLQVNYAVDPAARAKITAHIHGRFFPQELIEIARAILELHDLELVSQGKLWRVVPIHKLGEVEEKPSFLAVRPRYITASSLVPLLRSFLSPQARVLSDRSTNILIIIGRPDNLKNALQIIKLVDQGGGTGFQYRIYPCQVLSAEVLTRYVEEALRSTALRQNGLFQRVKLIPLKELDQILVVARNEEDMERAWSLMQTLDRGEFKGEEIFIYQVENGDAEEIAKLLEDIFSQGKSSGRKTVIKAKKSRVSTISAALEGRVKIVPDKTNNMLLIRATKEDYRNILKILRKIDIIPRQVVIEVLIAEITLNKALEYGLEWYLKTQFKLEGRPISGEMVFSRENRGPVTLGSASAFTYALFRGDSLRSLLYALSSISKINILSNPVLLATDNKEAHIQIGQEVPIITQKVTNTSASIPTITSSVQYRDTGIILRVKPHINSSGLVKLDIVQEVSNAQKNYLGLDSPLITKRRVETSLVVEDGQTIILGGLIDTRNEIGKTGIPILRDLPLMGKLFEWTTTSRDRTELFVAITPHVVRSREEAERVMRDFKRRIRELRKRLQKEFHNPK